MWRNVLPGDIADKLLEPEWISIKHEAGLSALIGDPKSSGDKKQTKFEGHIVPRQTVFVQFDPRDIVDTPSAVSNQGSDFVDPGLARVVNFKRGTRDEATNEDNKHNGVEQRPISLVERTVDEDTTFIIGIPLNPSTPGVRRHVSPRAGR